MAEVTSSKYPNLWVHDLGVRFVDGKAEVEDPKVLDALASVEGVEVPKREPRRSKPRRKSDDD